MRRSSLSGTDKKVLFWLASKGPFRVVKVGSYLNFLSEPTGSVAPQLNSHMIDVRAVVVGSKGVVLCPAQAFPVPHFR